MKKNTGNNGVKTIKTNSPDTQVTLVFILGMHRSGTSSLSGALAQAGIGFGDNLIPAASDNPTGFWEDKRVVALNDKILSQLSMQWDSLTPVPAEALEVLFKGQIDLAAGYLASLAGKDDSVVAVKDPRMCRLMPFWRQAAQSAGLSQKAVLMLRDPNEVASSLFRRNHMDREYASALWLCHTLEALDATAGQDLLLIDYGRLINAPATSLAPLWPFIGVEISDEEAAAAAAFLDKDLRHHSSKKAETRQKPTGVLHALAAELYAVLLPGVGKLVDAAATKQIAAIRHSFLALSGLCTRLELVEDLAERHAREDREWLLQQIANAQAEIASFAKADDQRSSYLATLEIELQNKDGYIRRLEKDSDKKGEYIEALELEEERKNDYIQTLEQEEIKKADYIVKLEQEALKKSDYIQTLEREEEKKSKHIVDLEKNILIADQQRKVTDSQIEALANARNELQRMLTDNQQQLTVAAGELQQLQARLTYIRNSWSWKLSAPLRVARRGLGAAKRRLVRSLNSMLNLNLARGPIFRAHNRLKALYKRFFMRDHSNASNRAMMEQLAAKRRSALENYSPLNFAVELPAIDISVVLYNSSRWLPGFMKSLVHQSYPTEKITLHFVNNGSTDDTANVMQELIADYAQRFRSVELYDRPNLGFGAGHDHAIQRATSDYVLVANVDLEFDSLAIEQAVRSAIADPDNTASWEFRQKPFEHPKYYDPVTLETAWSSHACILMARSAYLSVGGYEKKIFMYGEDVELSYRFRDRGYSVKYVPSAVVWHHTYEYASEVKPIQVTGSTLANAYLRLRYGTFWDIMAIFGLYLKQLNVGIPIRHGRRALLRNLAKIVGNIPYFLLSRKKSALRFPFRGWDYEMQRDGAFLTLEEVPDTSVKVSVVTRTYAGRQAWLNESVMSVINQTYKNVELVVVEDGGDSHRDFVERVAESLPEGKSIVYSAQPKHGRSYNGNAGLALASGTYVVFLDDDDLLFPDHIEILLTEALKDRALAGTYSLSWEVETRYQPGEIPHYSEELHSTPAVFRQMFSHEVLCDHNYLPIQAVLFKRELFDKFGGFDVNMDALEDWDLWVRYASGAPFKLVEKTTSLFRTPHDIDERARRHMVLHDAYAVAKKKQCAFLEKKGLVAASE